MDGIAVFFAILMVLVIFALIFTLSLPNSSQKESKEKLPGLEFIPTQMYRGTDGAGGLAVNEETYQTCLLKDASTPPRLVPLGDLVGLVLVKNGEMIRQRFRTRPKSLQLFVQAVQDRIQPLISPENNSGGDTSNQRIDLILAIHDEEDPLHIINFLDMETKEGGILFEKAMGNAKHWYYLLDGLILKGDHMEHLQGDIRDDGSAPPLDPVAAEIEKLAELMDNELLTEYEFKTLKEKLLAGKS